MAPKVRHRLATAASAVDITSSLQPETKAGAFSCAKKDPGHVGTQLGPSLLYSTHAWCSAWCRDPERRTWATGLRLPVLSVRPNDQKSDDKTQGRDTGQNVQNCRVISVSH